jgi:hypothetical protein
MSQPSTSQHRLHAWLVDDADEAMMRWIFRVVLLVTTAVLAFDLADRKGWVGGSEFAASPAEITEEHAPPDSLPSLLPSILAPLSPGDQRQVRLPQPDDLLARPMTFELIGGGKLLATGTITSGVSASFASEVGKHGDYIRTVVLNSPGGSVADALIMGRLVRARKFATEVESGKYCVSSCPLVLAGGVERRTGDKAIIGVHQVAAMGSRPERSLRDEMSIVQNISAQCVQYLDQMGIGLQVWVHAMETPHDRLFVFKPDELRSFNLVTAGSASLPPAAPGSRTRS